jgi:hypothetical protein
MGLVPALKENAQCCKDWWTGAVRKMGMWCVSIPCMAFRKREPMSSFKRGCSEAQFSLQPALAQPAELSKLSVTVVLRDADTLFLSKGIM